MKVNVSYSVALEDVLDEVRQLYTRERAKLEDKLEIIERSLEQEYTDKNLNEIIIAIDEYRMAIGSFDLKLVEMDSILTGYRDLQIKLRAAQESTQENQN